MKFRKSTNLEQAQRLLNCGVKESTADMSWRELIDRAQMTHEADGVTLCTLPYKEAALIYGEDGITPGMESVCIAIHAAVLHTTRKDGVLSGLCALRR